MNDFVQCVTNVDNNPKQTRPNTIELTNSHLHPEEQPLGSGLELEDINPAGGALVDTLELTVVREDDQVLMNYSE